MLEFRVFSRGTGLEIEAKSANLCVGTFALIVAFGGKTMTFESGFLNW